MTAKSERIIIIDDEQRMCESLTALLTKAGMDVRAFQVSTEAIEVIKSERVDLVVSDIKMPLMDGIEILKAVKQIDDEIPVILMTGYASLETALEAVQRGAYDYLLKPVEFAQLELTVKRALEKRRSDLDQRALMEQLHLSNIILESRVSELNALYEAGKSIGSTANINELLRKLVTLATTVTNAEIGSIMLLDSTGESLTIEAAIGLDEKIVRKTRLPVGASIAGYVAKTAEPLVVDDIESDERFKRINRERYSSTSLLCVPLVIKGNTLGVINMSNKQTGDGFDKNDLKLLTTFASQAAVAVDDARQFAKNKRRLVEFEILHECARELANIQSWVDFRDHLLSKLKRVFSIDYALWFDWNPKASTLVTFGAMGCDKIPLADSGRIDLKKISRDSVTVKADQLASIDHDDIVELSLYTGELIKTHPQFPEPHLAYMAIPIRRGGELASLFFLGADGEEPYTKDDISLAQLVISQATVLFEKEKAMLNATRLITMGNMISEISHDLRKPLTSIKGALQLLKVRWEQKSDPTELYQMAQDEIHRMNELVRELVDFS
ncbi:MAG: response regulator, partial [candidate division Zixibacteria bacterium]